VTINRIADMDFGRHFAKADIRHIEYLTSYLIDGAAESHSLETFVPIHFETAGHIVPHKKLAGLKSRAVEFGYWQESPHNYSAGRRSKAYRIAPQYWGCRIRKAQADNHIAAKLAAWKAEQDSQPVCPAVSYTREIFNSLDTDLGLATDISLSIEETKRYLIVLPLIEMHDPAQRYCKPCSQGRIHSQFTRTARAMRAAYSLGGRPLYGIDIKNSQLLFALFLFHFPAVFANFDFSQKFYGYTSLPTLNTTTITPYVLPFLDWTASVQEGRWYEFIAERLPGWSRERVKKAGLPVVFGPNCYRGPFKVACEEAFPAEMRILHDIKAGGHAYLPRVLQFIESSFVIGRVVERLRREKIPVVTLHDSLFSTEEHLDRIEEIILAEARCLGFTLTLHREAA
jgi:hypothetical protein